MMKMDPSQRQNGICVLGSRRVSFMFYIAYPCLLYKLTLSIESKEVTYHSPFIVSEEHFSKIADSGAQKRKESIPFFHWLKDYD